MKLYAAYLKVFNFEMGDDFFVPTNFIGERSADGRLHLTINMNTVKRERWSACPTLLPFSRHTEELA